MVVGGPNLGANFTPPAGRTLEAGATYRAEATQDRPTAGAGRLVVWRDGTICGLTAEEYFADYRSPALATGWFHVDELEYGADGQVSRLAATYEMNCQEVGGPPGFEGSVAVNSSLPPAPVPDSPATPGPVTGLTVTNTGPDGGGVNSTTLTWTNPEVFGDVTIDMVQSSDQTKLPALLGTSRSQLLYAGRASRYHKRWIDFMDTRTYRVVPRSTYGRLGEPTFVTVLGTRLSIPEMKQTITIGQEAQVSGRLSESWDYVDPADVMNGPALAGRTVLLCQQSSVDYVDGECRPVDRTTTTADGHFTLSTTPTRNSYYSVRVPASSELLGNTSYVLSTLVAPEADLRAAAAQRVPARITPRKGSTIRFTTSRARAGSRGEVRLQRLDGSKWRTIVTKRLGSGPASRRLAIPYREHKRGVQAYRVLKPGDAHHVNGYSRIVRVRAG